MEKDQVTIAVRASGLTGPLGQHVASVYVTQNGYEQQFVIVAHDLGVDSELMRLTYPPGPVDATSADILCCEVGNAVYDYIVKYKGVQPALLLAAD